VEEKAISLREAKVNDVSTGFLDLGGRFVVCQVRGWKVVGGERKDFE